MSEWIKQIKLLNPSKHTPLIVLLSYLKEAIILAKKDQLPMVDIILDGTHYLLVKKTDFTERFGE